VGPHRHLRLGGVAAEKRHQRLEGLGHVQVADIPRRMTAAEHRAVILFGVLRQPRILLGEKELLLGDAAVEVGVFTGAAFQIDKLLDDGVLARFDNTCRHRVAVRMRVAGKMIETRVARASAPGRLRIHLVEIPDDGLHRRIQAVEIEPVKTDLVLRVPVVPAAQPADERQHFGVAPHPARKPLEPGECRVGILIGTLAAHEAVHPVGIGPVAFNRHRVEAVLLDQVLRDAGTEMVEVVGAVRCLAEHEHAGRQQPIDDARDVFARHAVHLYRRSTCRRDEMSEQVAR
jgi:hypothetical protein